MPFKQIILIETVLWRRYGTELTTIETNYYVRNFTPTKIHFSSFEGYPQKATHWRATKPKAYSENS